MDDILVSLSTTKFNKTNSKDTTQCYYFVFQAVMVKYQGQSQQIPYEVVPTIEPLHHSRDIMIDSQEIRLHAWLLDNVLAGLAHIDIFIS